MALTTGTVHSVETIRSEHQSPLQFAAVLFTMSGTYDQSANSSLVGVPTLIQNSRRNGKTVTMRTVGLWQAARKDTNPALLMALKTVAISSADVTFEITEGASANVIDFSTELAAATIPTQSEPFGILVGFTEA
jgi:hypothetical protein